MLKTYTLYLYENNKEQIILSSEDPIRIRNIIIGKSMRKRLRNPNNLLRLTCDGKNYRLDRLERLCLDIWLEESNKKETIR